MGRDTLAYGQSSVAMGTNTSALGDYSFTTGSGTIASGIGSVAMGENNIAENYSVTFGRNNFAGGDNLDEPFKSQVTGFLVMNGLPTLDNYSGYSYAFGLHCSASKTFTFAGGLGSQATGIGSLAMGLGLSLIHI